MTDLPATRSEGGADQVDTAKVAFTLEQAILKNATRIAEDTWELAADLYHFHEIGGWSLCGYDTLEEFLARPELGLSRSQFFRMTKAYRDLVVVRKIDVDELKQIEPSKVQEVIPAIMRGTDPDKALADAKELGRRDLREKYRKGDAKEGIKPSGKPSLPEDDLQAEDAPHLEPCPTCGTMVDPVLLPESLPPVIDVEPADIVDDGPPVVEAEPVDPTPEAHSDAGEDEEATDATEDDVEDVPQDEAPPSVNEEAYAIRAATRTLAGVVEGTAAIAGVTVSGALKELRKRASRDDGREAAEALKSLGLTV